MVAPWRLGWKSGLGQAQALAQSLQELLVLQEIRCSGYQARPVQEQCFLSWVDGAAAATAALCVALAGMVGRSVQVLLRSGDGL